MKVGFVTCSGFVEGAPDDLPAMAELRELGWDTIAVVWDDASVDWAALDAVILRSTWDYYRRPEAFLAWLTRTAERTEVWNPPGLVRWNSYKGYITELGRRGIEVVPTEVVSAGSTRSLASVRSARGWSDVVIKPAIGAAAYRLQVVREAELDRGEAHLRSLLQEGDALIQPWLERAQRDGERSLIFLGGRFSHAVEYAFVLEHEPRVAKGVPPEPTLLRKAERALACLDEPPLYARADFLPGGPHVWWLSELELIEPDLFLRCNAGAPRRFARAIVDAVRPP